MRELIDKQAAIDALAKYIHNVDKVIGTGRLSAYDCKDAATSVFEELPSAQPEITRCKDCIYYHPYYCEIWSKFGTVQTRENGFCYMAERKDDERSD